MAEGYLIVSVYADNIGQPVEGAEVEIVGREKYITNVYGKTPKIALHAPEKEYSEHYQTEVRPYSTYELKVVYPGLRTVNIRGVEILPGETSLQDIYMHEEVDTKTPEEIDLGEHLLWDYVAKVPESPIKAEDIPAQTEPRVLQRINVPEYVIVHNGVPSSTTASRYYVLFPDYIKNVASSEIYSTWPRETIKANVHAIVSFTLNRVFTEWWRARGYTFTITSSPAYDQKYTHNRTIFATIAQIVDDYFNTYIRFPNMEQPFFAQYNDGIVSNNAGWLSQWGSKTLGDQGYTALQILRHYYGSNATLSTAEQIEGLPLSFPGFNLRVGSCGQAVQVLQARLNVIRRNYPALPLLAPVDGKFGPQTKAAVEKFQSIFNLTVDGVVGFATWYKVAYVYIAVAKLISA